MFCCFDVESLFVFEFKWCFFVIEKLCVWLLFVFLLFVDVQLFEDYFQFFFDVFGKYCVVFMQVGYVLFGCFDKGENFIVKSFKKYVVCGKGCVQLLYFKMKGKLCYGLWLWFQNVCCLLVEMNEKLILWYEEFGEFDQIYYSCFVCFWLSFFEVMLFLFFWQDDDLIKILCDVLCLIVDVLKWIYCFFEYGWIEELVQFELRVLSLL